MPPFTFAAMSDALPLSAVLEAVESQVPQSAERDRVLDAGRRLASCANQKAVRSLAGQWDVRQKVGGVNRGTTDILNEVRDNVRRVAVRLLQTEEVRAEDASSGRKRAAVVDAAQICLNRARRATATAGGGRHRR